METIQIKIFITIILLFQEEKEKLKIIIFLINIFDINGKTIFVFCINF